MRVLTWNVNGRKNKLAQQFARCVELDADTLCLQEVTLSTLDEWSRLLSGEGYSLLEPFGARLDAGVLTGRRKYLSVVASRGRILEHPDPMLPAWPERVASGVMQIGRAEVSIHSVHLPAGASDRTDGSHNKSEMFEYLARYLSARPDTHRIVCGDFNSPWEERADGVVLCYGGRFDADGEIVARRSDRYRRQLAAESAMMSREPVHTLRDAYRVVHGIDHSGYSYVVRRSGNEWRRRYDHTFVSSHFMPVRACYDTDGLRLGLSDHAAMLVELAFG